MDKLNLEAVNKFLNYNETGMVANLLDDVLTAMAYMGTIGREENSVIGITLKDLIKEDTVQVVKSLRDLLRQTALDNDQELYIEKSIDYGCK